MMLGLLMVQVKLKFGRKVGGWELCNIEASC
jgi:hypothetical protein